MLRLRWLLLPQSNSQTQSITSVLATVRALLPDRSALFYLCADPIRKNNLKVVAVRRDQVPSRERRGPTAHAGRSPTAVCVRRSGNQWQIMGVNQPVPGRVPRVLLSILITLHFTAVLSAAFSVGPASPLVRATWDRCRPYLQACYLNHGFHFFAPNPGPSHLLDWGAELRDKSWAEGRLPDPATRPRLLYHRYFMLTENAAGLPPELRLEAYRAYQQALCRQLQAEVVHMSSTEHLLPTPEFVLQGGRLDAPQGYVEEALEPCPCPQP